MINSKIQNILIKFINNEANITELELLDKWLTSPENVSVFNHFIEIEYLTVCSINMEKYNIDKAKIEISKKIKATRRQKKLIVFKRISIAASIMLFVGLGYSFLNESFIQNQGTISNAPTIITKTITPGSSKAILTLGNGNQVSLTKDQTYKNKDVTSDGETLTYESEKVKKREPIEYNDLTIPRGGKYFIVLADGSKVWLNSESKLKYPTKFIDGEERNIELVYGEAYFEISPSSEHNGSEFNVITKNQKVNVIGTEFNIKAYNDESFIATTLIGGKILIEKNNTKQILLPNQQAKTNIDSNIINISTIDVSNEIAWVKGLFSFEEAKLDDMMKTLSRWYNIDVVFENSSRKEFEFTGILERTKTIEDIIDIIKKTSKNDEITFDIAETIIIIK